MTRTTIRDIKNLKDQETLIPMVTAYDYTSAKLAETAGLPLLLVGDSLGQWLLGYEDTLPVTMEEMLHHVKAVVRGTTVAHVVADMPFMSYQSNIEDAVINAGRMLKEGGAQSVKLEGGLPVIKTVTSIVATGIPVMGHIGFTPQSYNQLGGYKIQGRHSEGAASIIEDALALEEAGAYAVVLEMMPSQVAKLVTDKLSIPTIGIAAGVHCDGQVQVFHDILGLIDDFSPKHTRRYAELSLIIRNALSDYVSDVGSGTFPSDQESHHMSPDEYQELLSNLSDPTAL